MVTFRYLLILFDFLLSDQGVEGIQFKNFFKPRALQVILNFLNFDLYLDLYAVKQRSAHHVSQITHVYLYHAINYSGKDPIRQFRTIVRYAQDIPNVGNLGSEW